MRRCAWTLLMRCVMACELGAWMPKHAQLNSSCGWNCQPDYFRSGFICRPCTRAWTCLAGWVSIPCDREADTSCVPCPPLQRNQVYTQECATRCAEGYATRNSTTCDPCTMGMFCTQGVAHNCSANCSTPMEGATSVRQCEGKEQRSKFVVSALVLILPKGGQTGDILPSACPHIEQPMLSWLEREPLLFFGCTMEFASRTMGEVRCSVEAATCASASLFVWLTQTAGEHEAAIGAAVRACVANVSDQTGVGKILIQNQGTVGDQQPHGNWWQTLQTRPSPRERFTLERQPWGRRKRETMSVLAWMASACMAITLTCTACCGLLCVKWGRKRAMDALFKKLLARHHALPH